MADENSINIPITADDGPLSEAVNRAIKTIQQFIGNVGQLSNSQKSAGEFIIENYKQQAAQILKLINLANQLNKAQNKETEDTGNKKLDILKRVAQRQMEFAEMERKVNQQGAKDFEARMANEQKIRRAMYEDEKKRQTDFLSFLKTQKIDKTTSTNAINPVASTESGLSGIGALTLGITAFNQGLQLARQLWDGIRSAVEPVVSLLMEGVKYLDLYRETEFGFAGLVYQLTDIYQGTRKVKDETEKWNASLEISKDITSQLQDAALKTKVTFSDLATGMQQGLGPMLQGGVSQEAITPFVTRFVQTMTALRVPLREIGQEIRAFFNLETNPRVARISFAMISQMAKQMGVDVDEAKAKLKELKQSGGLDEWFLANTQGMEHASELVMKGTMGGMLSNLAELKERILALGTEELYKNIIDGIEGVTDSFVTFDAQGKVTFNKDFVDGIKLAADALGSVITALAGIVKELPGLIALLRDFGNSLDESVPNWLKTRLSESPWKLNLGDKGSSKVNKNDEWWKNDTNDKGSLDAWLINALVEGLDYHTGGGKRPLGVDMSRITQVTGSNKQTQLSKSFIKFLEEQNRLFAGPHEGDSNFIGPSQPYGPYITEEQRYSFRNDTKNPPDEKIQKEIDKAIKKALELQRSTSRDIRDAQTKSMTESMPKYWQNYFEEVNKNADKVSSLREKIDELTETLGKNHPSIKTLTNNLSELRRELTQLTSNKMLSFDSWMEMKKVNSAANITAINNDNAQYQWLKDKWAPARHDEDKRIREGQQIDEKASQQSIKDAQKAADEFNKRVDLYFRNPLAKTFEGITTGGAKGFLNAMQGGFQDLISKGAVDFANILAGGDLKIDPVTGVAKIGDKELSNTEVDAYKARQRQLQTGVMLTQVGLGSYQNARQNYQGSITGGILGGAMAGASTGQIGLAVAAAIVGGIAAALGKAETRSEYKYASPAINAQGEGVLYGAKNLNPEEQKDMVARMTDAFNKFWNGYIKLALKVSADLPKLTAISLQFQSNPSGNFLKHFEEMLKSGIGDKVSLSFFDTLSKGFEKLGMTADRFRNIWTKFDKLDPEKALELLNLVADTLISFNNVGNFYASHDTGLFNIGGFNYQRGVMEVRSKDTYAQGFDESTQNILRMQKAVESMVGEDQIRAANELGNLLNERVEKEKQLMEQFNRFLEDSNRQFGDLRRNLVAEGIGKMGVDDEGKPEWKPDLEGQFKFWEEYINEVVNHLNTATNLEELQFWQSEFFKAQGNMGNIARQQGPEEYEAWRQWMVGADGKGGILGIFQSTIQATVSRWGDEIKTKNDAMWASIQPTIDKFKGTFEETGTKAGELGGAIGGLIEPVNKVAEGFNELIPIITTLRDAGKLLSTTPADNTDGDYSQRVVSRRIIATTGLRS